MCIVWQMPNKQIYSVLTLFTNVPDRPEVGKCCLKIFTGFWKKKKENLPKKTQTHQNNTDPKLLHACGARFLCLSV